MEGVVNSPACLITSRLYYCNALFTWVCSRLLWVLSARSLTGKKKGSYSISSVISSLHSFPRDSASITNDFLACFWNIAWPCSRIHLRPSSSWLDPEGAEIFWKVILNISQMNCLSTYYIQDFSPVCKSVIVLFYFMLSIQHFGITLVLNKYIHLAPDISCISCFQTISIDATLLLIPRIHSISQVNIRTECQAALSKHTHPAPDGHDLSITFITSISPDSHKKKKNNLVPDPKHWKPNFILRHSALSICTCNSETDHHNKKKKWR